MTASSPLVRRAIRFDGSTYCTRGAQLTGAVDAKVGTCSVWVKPDGGNLTERAITRSANTRYGLQISNDNLPVVFVTDTLGVVSLQLKGTTALAVGPGWHHLLWSWDVLNALGHFYLNDVQDELLSARVVTNTVLDYTDTNMGFGAYSNGTSKFNGCIAEWWWSFADYLDITVAANRRKFITAGLQPVFLGVDGSLPTGTAPIIYMRGDVSTTQTNSGSGGNFSVAAGSISLCEPARLSKKGSASSRRPRRPRIR